MRFSCQAAEAFVTTDIDWSHIPPLVTAEMV